MFGKITQLFKVKDLRNKIIFVLAMLVIFRIAAAIPVPGIDLLKLKRFFETNQLFGLLNIFSGGAMSNFSIAMLGVAPYITATIIMQLLTMIFPQIEEMYKDQGEAGRHKFNQISRLLTVPLGALQSYAMITLLQKQGVVSLLSLTNLITTIVIITAGTVFLMWIGELISEKGIGNGVSLIIFAGIIAGMPMAVQQVLATWDASKIPIIIGFVIAAVLIIAGIVIITEAQRNIAINYAKQVRGRKMYGGVSTYLPMRLNQAGVIPIIFAISIMLFPGMAASFLATTNISWLASGSQRLAVLFQNQLLYGALYFILVILFTYFYTAITFDPKTIAENLQKQGGFVPGIRPGEPTAAHIKFILHRTTLVGAMFLGVVAVLPFIMQSITNISALAIGGTGLLIVVSVVLETMKQIDSQLVMREYDGF
ncbi:MAG: preprotein translocase subunit SecY [bacterium]